MNERTKMSPHDRQYLHGATPNERARDFLGDLASQLDMLFDLTCELDPSAPAAKRKIEHLNDALSLLSNLVRDARDHFDLDDLAAKRTAAG
jgi:hypothetical protein